jgi:MYXO-CTERM domain-containing protein
VRDHAARLPHVVLVRLGRTFELYRPHTEIAFSEARDRDVELAGVYAYYALALLSLGAVVALRRRRRDLVILLSTLPVVVVITVAGYGLPRFREPFDISLVVLAALALARLAERFGGRAA